MCVVGWFGVVSRPKKPDALSICSRRWSNESVWVVDKACREKHRWGEPHPPSQEKRQVFQLRSESRLLSFSHSQGWISLFFERLKNEDFFQTKLKLKKPTPPKRWEVWVGEHHRSVYDNRLSTHHLMDSFILKVRHPDRPLVPSVRSLLFNSVRQPGCPCVHTYILHSLARSISFRLLTLTTYLLHMYSTDLGVRLKGVRSWDKSQKMQPSKQGKKSQEHRKKRDRHFFLGKDGGGERRSRAAVPYIHRYYLIINRLEHHP